MLPSAVLLGMLSGAPAHAAEPALAWDWSEPQRYYFETEVRLPLLMWFFKQYNKQARVSAFQVRLVADCEPVFQGKRRAEVMCAIEDVGLKASGLPQEEGLLQPILDELDQRLSAASVQLIVRDDGRLANIDLEGLDRHYQRTGRMNENLRLIVTRAFAGLDLPLPRAHDGAIDTQWVQRDSWILRAPVATGNLGTADVVHELVGDPHARVVTIETEGRGMVVPSGGMNRYDVVLDGQTTFDRVEGRILDRTWTMIGAPTPGSAIAEGTAGYPYLQVGRIVHLEAGQGMDVGDTEALDPIDAPTALQQWQVLGLYP